MFDSTPTVYTDLTDCCIGQLRCPCGRPPDANLVAEPVTIERRHLRKARRRKPRQPEEPAPRNRISRY